MKILFVTNEIPYPPDNGVRIVSHHAMRLMYEAGHELALAVLTEETDDLDTRFRKAASFCQNGMAWWIALPSHSRLSVQLTAILTNRLFFNERHRCTIFRKKLIRLIEDFQPDVIHFDLIPMTQYHDVTPIGVGTVASINDSYALTLENGFSAGNYKGIQHAYRKIQYHQTRRYEKIVYPRFNSIHVMAEVDAAYLHQLNTSNHTDVIPNGVDPSLFGITDETYGCTDVIFVAKLADGNLVYLRRFLELSWPIIHKECPEVKLHIVGKKSPELYDIEVLAERAGGVFFKGYVECLADAYRGCGLAVVPVNKNCGIVNKAIEAMAAGLVVVGFEKTFAGVSHGRAGEHFVAVQDYASMGHAVVALIRNEPYRLAIQKAAHHMATKYFTWPSRSKAYEQMYQYVAQQAKKHLKGMTSTDEDKMGTHA